MIKIYRSFFCACACVRVIPSETGKLSGVLFSYQAGVEKDRLNLQKLAAWKTILVPAFPENTMQVHTKKK